MNEADSTDSVKPLDAYRKRPGGPAACILCGHRLTRHESSVGCLRAALLAIADVLKDETATTARNQPSVKPDAYVHEGCA